MVRMIMKLVQIRNFTLTTSDSKQSRLHRLKSNAGYAVSQGSVLAPLLFNIYTYELPFTISRKFTYADDLALFYYSGNWKAFEGTLNQGMFTHLMYLQTWKLNFSTAAFHLNNQKDQSEINIYNSIRLLPFSPTPLILLTDCSHSVTISWHGAKNYISASHC